MILSDKDLDSEIEWLSRQSANFANLLAIAEELKTLRDASRDALSGWRYIRRIHGDFDGVGWDRVENALTDILGPKP